MRKRIKKRVRTPKTGGVENGRPATVAALPVPTLEELIAAITPQSLHGEVWPDAEPVGREVLDPWE